MDFTIFLEECGNCKECCRRIPVCVCDYRVIEAIISDMLPNEIINQLRIYQIEEAMLDYTAKIWWYFPNHNLLKCMTKDEEGFYYLLIIPRLQEGWPFLSEDIEKGCRFPDIKPYNCAIYPYYLEDGEFKINSTCKYAINKNIIEIQLSLRRIAENFTLECLKNQEHYFVSLKKIQERQVIPQINYHKF